MYYSQGELHKTKEFIGLVRKGTRAIYDTYIPNKGNESNYTSKISDEPRSGKSHQENGSARMTYLN